MKTEIRDNGIKNCTVITADEGKVLRRISNGEVVGKEVWLGFTFYIDGVRQKPPHLDVPEDFDEIDETDDIGTDDNTEETSM